MKSKNNNRGKKTEEWKMKGHLYWSSQYPYSPYFLFYSQSQRIFGEG